MDLVSKIYIKCYVDKHQLIPRPTLFLLFILR